MERGGSSSQLQLQRPSGPFGARQPGVLQIPFSLSRGVLSNVRAKLKILRDVGERGEAADGRTLNIGAPINNSSCRKAVKVKTCRVIRAIIPRNKNLHHGRVHPTVISWVETSRRRVFWQLRRQTARSVLQSRSSMSLSSEFSVRPLKHTGH